MGGSDLKEMDAGTMDTTGRGMTQAGKICGMIACILLLVSSVIIIALLALGMLSAVHRPN
jgi:hypothetical protein